MVGTTTGCFGTGCSTFLGSVSSTDWQLAFTGNTFDVTTSDPGGLVSSINLGSFSRTNTNPLNTADPAFRLNVAFSIPVGNEIVSASVVGTTTGTPLDINFPDTWQTVNFSNASGQGSFDFRVVDITQLTKNSTRTLSGQIQNATFRATSPTPPAPVPEPASLVLLGSGLAAAAWSARRRHAAKTP